jgi:hypothetical protein
VPAERLGAAGHGLESGDNLQRGLRNSPVFGDGSLATCLLLRFGELVRTVRTNSPKFLVTPTMLNDDGRPICPDLTLPGFRRPP